MRHQLVICTRNRADDVATCLESVFAQTTQPDSVLIVDSSTDAKTKMLVDSLISPPCPIIYMPSLAGLTHQRNVALSVASGAADVVHFVDDDAVLEPAYIEEILACFAQDPIVGGVGGRISNLPQHSPQWYRTLLRLNSSRQGALLASGVNVLAFTGASVRRVDWLSGCSMSYRTTAISGLWFDEERRGNGVGEDVDFSARVAASHPLAWTPFAVLEHRQSPVNREAVNFVQRRVIRSRWRLASQGVGGVRKAAVVCAVLADAAIALGKAARFRSRHYGLYAWANLLGLVDASRGKEV